MPVVVEEPAAGPPGVVQEPVLPPAHLIVDLERHKDEVSSFSGITIVEAPYDTAEEDLTVALRSVWPATDVRVNEVDTIFTTERDGFKLEKYLPNKAISQDGYERTYVRREADWAPVGSAGWLRAKPEGSCAGRHGHSSRCRFPRLGAFEVWAQWEGCPRVHLHSKCKTRKWPNTDAIVEAIHKAFDLDRKTGWPVGHVQGGGGQTDRPAVDMEPDEAATMIQIQTMRVTTEFDSPAASPALTTEATTPAAPTSAASTEVAAAAPEAPVQARPADEGAPDDSYADDSFAQDEDYADEFE